MTILLIISVVINIILVMLLVSSKKSSRSESNLTSQKNSDSQQEIRELKKVESFRKEFLGNVSHELKTPLFNIQGYIHTLLDGAVHDNEINIDYLRRAARSAERLSLIVDDLESISKLESGELVLDERIFDVHDLVKDVYDSLELKAREKSISLEFENAKPTFVHGDKERVRQVLVNLVANAINYGRMKGSVVTAFIESGPKAVIEIRDNGVGIDSQHLPRIFERFYRVDQSRSREAGGTGLGLAIVKHIIEAHHQTISVKSTVGVGTTFSFTLNKA